MYIIWIFSEDLNHGAGKEVFCGLAVAEGNVVELSYHLVRNLQEDNAEAKAADVVWGL